MWVPRAPSREHVGLNHSRKLCGAFKSYLENPVIFCVIEAGNFLSVEELYEKRHWLFPEEKFVFHLSKGELWGDILGQGNGKNSLGQGLLLIQLSNFMSKLKFPCEVGGNFSAYLIICI